MAYIYGLIVVALLFATMHYFTELTNKQKTLTTALLVLVVLGAIAYNKYTTAQRELMLSVVTAYEQGKTLECNGIKVNAKLYDLSIGTYTFIGRKNTPNYAKMISASTCK